MSAKGFCIPQEGHVVNILPPFGSAAATSNSDVWSMEGYAHCDIIIQMGTTAGAASFILYECDNFTPTTATAIAATYYAETTDSGDTLGAATALASTGLATSANDNIMYVVSVDAQQLTDGYPNLQLRFADLDNTTYLSAVAILSGARYAYPASATAIA
jgi:hypothetical protein